MDLPLWVPWVLVLSLALPVAVLRLGGTRPSRAGVVASIVPAAVMALVATGITLDRTRVSQDELDEAVADAASVLDGSVGPVNASSVATLVGDRLARDVVTRRSELMVVDELTATYSVEVRPDVTEVGEDESGPAACLDVQVEVLDGTAPDLRLSTLDARSGPCG